MKVLQTIKYYHPSKGGMESVAKNIVDGILFERRDINFIIYANSHTPQFKREILLEDRIESIKESTPIIFKSQPLNFKYPMLRKLISEVDVVHHHYPFPNMELALLRNINLLRTKKFIITWHANINNSRWSWIERFYAPITKKLLDTATHIVVTSPQLAEASNLLSAYTNKIKIIPLTFDPLLSGVNNAKSFPKNRMFRLLFVGKLRAYKGLSYLIDAIRDLPVEMYIVGEGEDRQSLIDKCKLLCISDKVFFENELSNMELEMIYKKCDLFILPSINEAEAFGVVQLEAMSNGLPVINTKLNSGVPFVSLNSITGLTVEPKNSILLKQAIEKIINDKDLYETYSKNSLERVKTFSREKMANSYLNIYGQ